MPLIPFALQWSIGENRLLALKDSVNGYLKSDFVTNIPEFEYYLKISPNGDDDESRGETWIFLHIKLKNVKKVVTDYTFTTESANYTKSDQVVYEKSIGWGNFRCKTEKFFDPEKKFIVDGIFIVKVYGMFKYETEDVIPAAITEQKWQGGKLGDRLWKKDDSKDFTIITDDGKEIEDDVEPLLIAQISASNVVCLTNCSVQTNSSKLNKKCMEFLMKSFASKTPLAGIKVLDKNIATHILQKFLASSDEATDTTTDADAEQQKWIGGELGDEFWKNDETKDFAIVTENGKELKVHKSVVGIRSKIFNAISESETDKAEIIGFPYDVVETGIKMIYDCNFAGSLSTEKLISLQHFHDKFNLPNLKAKVEPLLIAQISASTACRLMNGSILTNSIRLREKCMEFLSAAFKSKTPLTDIDILNKDIALKILDDSLYHIVETRQ